jgi:hypothetical protein
MGDGSGRSHPPPPLIRPGVGVMQHGLRWVLCGLREGRQTQLPPARVDHRQLRHRRHRAIMLRFNLRMIRRA